MSRAQLIWNILVGLVSGPILSALVFLIPLGVLIGISTALDPSLAIGEYEYAPEEDLFLPWLILAALISAANVRLAIIMSKDRNIGRIFEVVTDRYLDDPSGAENIHGHRGKRFAEEFIRYLGEREGDEVAAGDPVGEDYGWGFWIGEKGYSPLWVAIAHAGPAEGNEKMEEYVLAVTLEPPVLPWRRLRYTPDFALRDRIERHLEDFLKSNKLAYTREAEDWVDPEPKTQPAARF